MGTKGYLSLEKGPLPWGCLEPYQVPVLTCGVKGQHGQGPCGAEGCGVASRASQYGWVPPLTPSRHSQGQCVLSMQQGAGLRSALPCWVSLGRNERDGGY